VVAHPASAALSSGDGARTLIHALLAATLFALFVRTFVVAAAVVPTSSMSPALLAGDRVLVNRLLFAPDVPPAVARWLPLREPRRGDVVWLRSPLDRRTAFVKRVVATAGERFAERRVPAGEVVVLGDHRADSLDSRSFGPVARAAISGRVSLVLWSSAIGARRPRLLEAVR